MKTRIDLEKLEEQCATISSCGRAMEDLYIELVECGMYAKKPGIPYLVEMLNERMRDANRKIEEELRVIMDFHSVDRKFIDVEILD